MSSLSTGRRYPHVAAWLVVAVVLALALQAHSVAAVTLDETVDGQQLLCRVLGSHPPAPVTGITADGRSLVQVTCHGGLLDGMTCDIVPGTDADGAVTSTCSRASIADGPHVAPSGGIEDVSGPDSGGPGGVGDVAVDPVVAEDPARGDPVVIPTPPGFPVEQTVAALADGCRLLGGEDVEISRPEEEVSPGSTDLRCIGGLLYDLHCTVSVESLTCQWLEPRAGATVDAVLTGVKVVGRAPPPVLAEQGDTPVPPTPTPPMDDDSGMDPTVVPTLTAPGNVGDNRAPAGDIAEDPVVGDPGSGGDGVPPTPVPTPPGPIDDHSVAPGGVVEDPTQNEPTPTEAPLR